MICWNIKYTTQYSKQFSGKPVAFVKRAQRKRGYQCDHTHSDLSGLSLRVSSCQVTGSAIMTSNPLDPYASQTVRASLTQLLLTANLFQISVLRKRKSNGGLIVPESSGLLWVKCSNYNEQWTVLVFAFYVSTEGSQNSLKSKATAFLPSNSPRKAIQEWH